MIQYERGCDFMNSLKCIYMGSKGSCCKFDNKNQRNNQKVDLEGTSGPKADEVITRQMRMVIDKTQLFRPEFQRGQTLERFNVGSSTYFGHLNENKQLKGFGIKINERNQYCLGNFDEGALIGTCLYFFDDGSYYQGEMVQNCAKDRKGFFKNQEMEYEGGFDDNMFEGEGHLKGKNFQFEGIFQKGKKVSGIFKWVQNLEHFEYQGHFDESEHFSGKGILRQPLGVYEGNFMQGRKEGQGIYYFNSRIRYEGEYKDNQKHGTGKIVNQNGTIAYAGNFSHGLPHGKGIATDQQGSIYHLQWTDGVYSHLL